MKHLLHSIGHVGWMSINLIVAGCLLVADCCLYVPPTRALLPSLLGLGFEALLWTNVLFSASWLFSQRKSWCVVSLLAIALSATNILSTYSHERGEAGEYAHEIKILSYNTHQCSQLKKADKNEVLRYVKGSGADIVFLQEYEVRKDPYYLTFQEAKRYLREDYPYTYFDFSIHNHKRQYGLAVFSKYPLENKTTIAYKSKANLSNYCDAIIDGDTIRLINNHLESNSFARGDLDIDVTTHSPEDFKRGTWNILSKMKKAYSFRSDEAVKVREAIESSPYPVIVAGDMNDVPVSYTYHMIQRGLEDTHLHSSLGKRGLTYMRKMLGVRIDYVLISKQMHTRSSRIDKVSGSDHYPYSCTICY